MMGEVYEEMRVCKGYDRERVWEMVAEDVRS